MEKDDSKMRVNRTRRMCCPPGRRVLCARAASAAGRRGAMSLAQGTLSRHPARGLSPWRDLKPALLLRSPTVTDTMLCTSTGTRAGVAVRSVARPSRVSSIRAAVPAQRRTSRRAVTVFASGDGEERKNDGAQPADPLASDFMKELQRRGIDAEKAQAKVDAEKEAAKEAAEDLLRRASGKAEGPFGQKPASPQWAKGSNNGMDDQLARSKKLNSEGLEGLIPRATELIKLGISSVLAFWPFIAAIAVLFTLTYKLFGSDFIHGGELYSYKSSPYVVPEGLLQEPTVDRFVPFDKGI